MMVKGEGVAWKNFQITMKIKRGGPNQAVHNFWAGLSEYSWEWINISKEVSKIDMSCLWFRCKMENVFFWMLDADWSEFFAVDTISEFQQTRDYHF